MVVSKKEKLGMSNGSTDLWERKVDPIPANTYVKSVANTEKMLIFSETGAGKTTFYFNILRYLEEQGLKKEKLMLNIIYPDRPTGIEKIYGIIPDRYKENINIFPVNNYEDTVIATATSTNMLTKHFEETKVHGWMVFELLENYWSFSQDYYCRQAYGESMGEYFAHMRNVLSKEKADKKTAYEAFAGPFGGPWPIIKFFHNFNWIDRIKRMPFNIVFTSELREETNKDSVFFNLGLRPSGEKHNMHRVDTILYLSHKGNEFFMRPYKLTGYKRTYSEQKITNKNGYVVHKQALKRLEDLGYKTSKMDALEQEAGIKLPVKKEKPKESFDVATEEHLSKKEIDDIKQKEEEEDSEWNI